jgi:predicted nucleotidyltransferase
VIEAAVDKIDVVLAKIKELADKYQVARVVLFGSRARGDHSPLSDYDLAIFGPALTAVDKARLRIDVEEIATLKKIDVVFVDAGLADDLAGNIAKEGVVIYEQTKK